MICRPGEAACAVRIVCALRELVAAVSQVVPALCLRTVVAREGPSFPRHFVRRSHVQVRRETAPLVVAHRVGRHRRHLVTGFVDDRDPQPCEGEDALELRDARVHGAGLQAADPAGRCAGLGREVTLAEVGEAPDTDDIPADPVVVLGAR